MTVSSKQAEEAVRLAREKEFHNDAFSDNRREVLDKYYSVFDNMSESFDAFLKKRSRGKRVLEYGCGPYSKAFDIAAETESIHAIDISEVAIEQMREQAEQEGHDIDFSVQNAEALEFEENAFDMVVGSSIIHHLDIPKSLDSIDKVLAPGGCALFSEPLGHSPIINFYRWLTPKMRTPDEHPLVQADLDMIKERFPDSRFEFYNLTTVFAVPFRKFGFFRSLVDKLNALDQWLFQRSDLIARNAWFCLIFIEKSAAAAPAEKEESAES